ncbi:hypothetical protein WUBG_02153 [Wuchereria bancrofti]|uniref:Uncharacterized protein n=1 Tax=Wuchereria bancrofti TaxID=6293 RepID=J9FHW6_WUCBA|nr:hypothetical protein WUBG_02153 [Wuchereria bancrofti]
MNSRDNEELYEVNMERSSRIPLKLKNWRSFTILRCCSVHLQMNHYTHLWLDEKEGRESASRREERVLMFTYARTVRAGEARDVLMFTYARTMRAGEARDVLMFTYTRALGS